MRLWLRLTLLLATLTLLPLLVTGYLAVRTASENATLRPEETNARDASTLATFVGSWVDGQARSLAGWQRVWDLRDRSDNYRINLLRAVHTAMEPAITVALVDVDGNAQVPPQYTPKQLATPGREPGTNARAAMLLERQPKTLTSAGTAIGTPYLPPDALAPVVPVAVGVGGEDQRIIAEISMAMVAEVFEGRTQTAAVLVDGKGVPVLGADHPYLAKTDLDALLDMGLDMTFSTVIDDKLVQGAIWAVPYTDWKVVVLAPPSMGERVAASIRNQTLRIAGLFLFVVLLVGLVIERTLTRSVTDLRAHAMQVTKGDYKERNLVDRGDEIGELGLALNVMSSRLEVGQAEIRAFQDELQDRVDARTRELKAAQEQLVRAGQIAATAQMGAGLAHELNNPLSGILGGVQLLRMRLPDEPGLQAVEEQAVRCRELVETMLRLEAGDVRSPDPTPADLGDVLTAAVARTRPAFASRGVKLVVRDAGSGRRVDMAAPICERVVSQLLEALCAGLPGGAELQVDVPAEGTSIRLTPSRPVAQGPSEDDWKAAGMKLWTARGLLDLAGGEVVEPQSGDHAWHVHLPALT